MTYRPSPFTSLPFEVLDLILSSIDDRKDLISVATTARALSSLIIPYHTEYRTVRISTGSPNVWRHLARRADLARNIRVLHMVEQSQCLPLVDRTPHTLVPGFGVRQPSDDSEDERVINIARAVRNMSSLRRFVWLQPWTSGSWRAKSPNYNPVWHALSQSRSLKSIKVVNRGMGLIHETVGSVCPLWRITNLQSLHLEGAFLCSLSEHAVSLMAQSPNLQSLTIGFAIDSPKVWEHKFPRLQKLVLTGNISAQAYSDEPVIRFLEAHPTLEHLCWFPLDSDSRVASGSLPCIKQLTTNNDFALSLMQDIEMFQRRIDQVSRIHVDQTSLPILAKAKGLALRELAVGQYDTLESIYQLAEIFPDLTLLDIAKFGSPGRRHRPTYTLEDYFEALSRFPRLEALPDIVLWERIQKLDEAKKEEAIMNLSTLCPNLACMGYWDPKTNGVVDIVLVRDGEKVSWEQRNPQYL